jgi:hypothetical protein
VTVLKLWRGRQGKRSRVGCHRVTRQETIVVQLRKNVSPIFERGRLYSSREIAGLTWEHGAGWEIVSDSG